jgi:hypothetical protein
MDRSLLVVVVMQLVGAAAYFLNEFVQNKADHPTQDGDDKHA